MDLCLLALNSNTPAEDVASAAGLRVDQVQKVWHILFPSAKRRDTSMKHLFSLNQSLACARFRIRRARCLHGQEAGCAEVGFPIAVQAWDCAPFRMPDLYWRFPMSDCEIVDILSRLRTRRAGDFDDYGRAAPSLAQRLLADCKARYRLGTFERSRGILRIIANSSPTKDPTSAYFKYLRASWNPGRGGPYPEGSY